MGASWVESDECSWRNRPRRYALDRFRPRHGLERGSGALRQGGYTISSSAGQALDVHSLSDRASSGGNVVATDLALGILPTYFNVTGKDETLELTGAVRGRPLEGPAVKL